MLTKLTFELLDTLLPRVDLQDFKGFKEIFSYFESVPCNYEIISDTLKEAKIHSFDTNTFITEDIIREISQFTNQRDIQCRINNTNVTIHIIYQNHDLTRLIDILLYVIAFGINLSTHTVKQVTFTYYLSSLTKKINKNTTQLGPKEINSGITYRNDCNIEIWRIEEIIKLTIHELIHCLSYDYKDDSIDIITHYQELYNVTSERMNTYEAYTELWTELINCYLISKFQHLSESNVTTDQYKFFITLLHIEQQFAFYQASKVAFFTRKSKDRDLNKKTNVVSYYLIRAQLWENIEKFIQFCITNNHNLIKLTHTKPYFDFLKQLPDFTKQSVSTTDKFYTTIKMTALELKVI